MIVEAGDGREGFPARLEEGFATAHGDLFKGFKAIGDEGGANNEELFNPGLGKPLEFGIGIRLQPGIAA